MILFNETRLDDFDSFLAEEIEEIEVVYGVSFVTTLFQILPNRVLDMHPKDQGDGVGVYGGYYTARTLTLRVLVLATTAAQLSTRLTSLRSLLDTGTKKPLVVSEIGGDKIWQALFVGSIEREYVHGAQALELDLVFRIPEPFAETEVVQQNEYGWPAGI
jgi:predicted phage tail component-like protein